MIEINSCKLILKLVDTETGELITKEATLGDFKDVVKKPGTVKVKEDNEPTAMLHMMDTKIQMNTKAQQMCKFEPGDKVAIEFEKKGRQVTPIMFLSEGKGNRLTKTFTISCRGQKGETLREYGTTFEVIPYEGKEGYFRLIGNIEQPEDDIIDVPEEIASPEELEDEFGLDEIDMSNFDF